MATGIFCNFCSGRKVDHAQLDETSIKIQYDLFRKNKLPGSKSLDKPGKITFAALFSKTFLWDVHGTKIVRLLWNNLLSLNEAICAKRASNPS